MPRYTRLNSIGTDQTYLATLVKPGTCKPSTRPAVDMWEEFIAPTLRSKYTAYGFKAFKTLPVGSAESVRWSSMRNTYFGEFCDATTQIVPPAEIPFAFKETTHRRFKDFKSRQQAGEIVLSPMEAYRGKITMGQGNWRGEATLRPEKPFVYHDSTGHERFPWVPKTGCPNYPRGRFFDTDYMARSTETTSYLSTVYRYDLFDAPLLRMPLPQGEVMNAVSSILSELHTKQPDVGLVTSTRAQAAEGLLDLSTTLAEAPDLLETILASIRVILTKYLECRRAVKTLKVNSVSTGDVVADIANIWMQYRYAIMPNIYTISDALDYFHSEITKYQTVRDGTGYTLDPVVYEGWSSAPVKMVDRCFIKHRFDLSLSKSDRYLSVNGLVTAWELLPLSFIIDWVLNIGDLLTALRGPEGSVQEAAMYSWQHKGDILLSHPDWRGPPIKVELEYYRANVILPETYLGLTAQIDMNWKRWLDAFALSWGTLKSSFKTTMRKLNK